MKILPGKPTAKPRAPLLVREAPELMKLHTHLTDGDAGFTVVDHARRMGIDHYKLVNIEYPELSNVAPRFGWFSIEEIGELAYGKGERRETRERF